MSRLFILGIFWISPLLAGAQPRQVEASDGLYDQFVLIRWAPSEKAQTYKVMRTADPRANTLEELSRDWQKSTWLCDYSAKPDVDYYYTVVASDGQVVSAISPFDKGYLKKRKSVAQEEELLSEAYGSQKRAFLLLNNLEVDRDTSLAGQTLEGELFFQNIFTQPVGLTEIRYFLSADAVLDWSDTLLGQMTLSSFPAESASSVKTSLTLPADLIEGAYYLLAVSSPEGDILASKTSLTAIQIVAE